MTLLSFNYDNDRYDCVWVTAARLLGVDFLKVSFALEELRSRLGETRGAGLNTLERICEIFDQALRYRVLDQGLLYSRDPTRFKTGHCIVYEKLDLSSANAGMTAEQWRFVDYQVLDARNYGDRESAPWTTIDAPHFNDNSAKFPVMVFAISPFNPKTFN
ncbi:hypothetical protein FRC06_002261 [Ceratobasidium sp. 370]|nr:hypothetical protein FRC06_002261 [Ceratobasidium sp. 370]